MHAKLLNFAFFALVALTCVHATITVNPSFADWMQLHGKQYSSVAEYARRMDIWTQNFEKGAGQTSPYSDLTHEEYMSQILLIPTHPDVLAAGMRASPHYVPFSELVADVDAFASVNDNPKSWDWRDKGVVTPIRDQGSVGSCWAFSATGAIASQRAMHGGALEELSVEQYLDCDALDCSVFGGWPYLAYEYAINAGGLNSESDYPYCAGFGKCYPCMPNKNTTFCGPPPSYCNRTCLAVPNKFVVSVSKWTQIPVNDSAIENALLTYGPLSVLINAETLQLHSGSGIWKPLFCDPDALDHAVLLIGYGEETTILGKTERYWLIANSWGTKWGDKGVFKMYRDPTNVKGTCGINTGVTLPTVK